MKVAFTLPEPQESGPRLTDALGESQTGLATMGMDRSSALVHAPRVRLTAIPTLPLAPGITVMLSPVAVAGEPLVIVHVVTAPACERTNIENEVLDVTLSGASTTTVGLMQVLTV